MLVHDTLFFNTSPRKSIYLHSSDLPLNGILFNLVLLHFITLSNHPILPIMKFSLVLLTSLVFSAVAEDLLFNAKMQWHEYEQAVEMNYTVKVVDDTEWANMSTADFAKYKAIVIADTASDSVDYYLDFFNDTKGVWGPAVQGNIIVIGKLSSSCSMSLIVLTKDQVLILRTTSASLEVTPGL
jgi:hypothetical protein